MILRAMLAASGSTSEPVLALDPSRGVIAMDLWETLNGCFKIPTSIELDLRNYPTYFLHSEGRLRILESYAKTGPTGCRGLP